MVELKRMKGILIIAIAFVMAFSLQNKVFAESYETISVGESKEVSVTEEVKAVIYAFTPEKTGYYTISSSDCGDADPVLYAYDSLENLKNNDYLQKADDIVVGDHNFEMSIYLIGSETYYFKATYDKGYGSYKMTLVKDDIEDISFTPARDICIKVNTCGYETSDSEGKFWYYVTSKEYGNLEEILAKSFYEDGARLTITYSDGSSKDFSYDSENNVFTNGDESIEKDHVFYNTYTPQLLSHWNVDTDNYLILEYIRYLTGIPVYIVTEEDETTANALADQINKLTDSSSEADVLAARTAFDKLSEKQKHILSAELAELQSKLEAQEKRIAEEKAKVKVTSIKLEGISHEIAAGKKIQLTARVSPDNASNKQLAWTSSNKELASVDSKGLVTISKNAAGKTVIITASAQDGSGKKASWSIELMKGAVKKITLKGKKKVKAGKTLKLKAKVQTTKGKANKKLQWTSSNKKYAAVNANGNVKTYKAGKGKTVKITAKATDGSGKKKTVKIKIK